jgi:hypothetical protein
MSTGAGAGSWRKTGVIAALCVGLAAACGTAQSKDPTQATTQVTQSVDQAQVTGYVTSFPSMARPSGPISVTVHGAPAAGLYRIIQGLRGSSGANCMENAQLYQISYASAKGTVDVAGYQCGGFVTITADGKTTDWTDRNCTLLSAVRRVVPATATATQQPGTPCIS